MCICYILLTFLFFLYFENIFVILPAYTLMYTRRVIATMQDTITWSRV